MKQQRGFIYMSGWDVAMIVAVLIGIGVFIGWAIPHLWTWLKPIIHGWTS